MLVVCHRGGRHGVGGNVYQLEGIEETSGEMMNRRGMAPKTGDMGP